MTLVVLCDGAPASLKAASWAAIPGAMMKNHEGEQLILLHVWNRGGVAPLGQQDDTEAAVPPLDDPGLIKRLPPSTVFLKTNEFIMSSKTTRDTLNYKLETMVIHDSSHVVHGSQTVPTAQPATNAVRSNSRHRPSGKMGNKKDTEQQFVELTSEDALAAAQREAEGLATKQANIIAQYAEERLTHHKANILFLGVGNVVEGKFLVVGHVGDAVLNKLRHMYSLRFIKANGVTLRVNTTLLRLVVVIVPRSGDDAALALNCNVVSEALGCCRKGSGDTVSVVIVAEHNTDPKDIELYSQTFDLMLQNNGEHAASGSVSPSQHQRLTSRDSQQAPQGGEEQVPASLGVTELCPSDAEGGVDPSTADARSVANEQSNQQEEEWPRVSVCHLRTTKLVEEPSVVSVPLQVVKYLQQHKTDVLVVSSSVPKELHFALLGMPKQHVFVVPSLEPPPPSGRDDEPLEPSEDTLL